MQKLTLACGLVMSTAFVACSSVPKAVPTASAAPAGATVAMASKTPKLVCEDTTQMGTHMQSFICLTPEQVAQRHKDSQDAARDQQNRPKPINSSAPVPPD